MTRHRFAFAPILFACALAAPLAAVPARAQDNQDVLNRLERLERDIRTLNQQLARGGQDAAPAASQAAPKSAPQFIESEGPTARALVRLDSLEEEVRGITGATESLSFRIDQLTRRLDQLLVDLDYRLARLEGTEPGSFSPAPSPAAAPAPGPVSKLGAMPPVAAGTGSGTEGKVLKDGAYQPSQQDVGVLGSVSKTAVDAMSDPQDAQAPAEGVALDTEVATAPAAAAQPAAPAPAQQASAPQSILPEGSAQERYRFAFDLTRQARYDEAELAFRAFIDAHGDDTLADNARYWLAETYYVRKRYAEAAQAFFTAYQKAPGGAKAADSLLKLGMTMAALEKTKEACATFGKLRKEFTPLKANVEQTLGREVKRLGCR